MNPENPTQSIPSAPENVPPAPPYNPERPKEVEGKNKSVLTMLSILLIILVGVVAFLAYQNWILQKQITAFQSNQPINNSANQPSPTADPTTDWKTFNHPSENFSFMYPPNLEVSPVPIASDYTSLKADNEYFAGVNGSDAIYLQVYSYKSAKTPSDWWTTDGKNRFDQLKTSVEQAMTPKATINLTYNTLPTTLADKNVLNVTVNSDYESPQTPKQRFLTIFQQNGYIVMTSYQDLGTTIPSLDISKQILSTFKFIGTNVISQTGQIESINPSGDIYTIVLKLSTGKTASLPTDLPSDTNPLIIIKGGRQITLSQFLDFFNTDASIKSSSYAVETEQGTIIKITQL